MTRHIEQWRPIKNFSLYMVSDFGRVKSLSRIYQRKGHYVTTKEKILQGWVKRSPSGKIVRVDVALRCENKTYQFRIHKLVLEAFVGIAPPFMEGCHNDGDPSNNKLSNLRWDTHSNNLNDSNIHGTKINPPIHFGSRHPQSKLNNQKIKEIRTAVFERGDQAKLAIKFKVSATTIARIRKGIGWNHVDHTS